MYVFSSEVTATCPSAISMLTQPLSNGRCHGSIVAESCTNWNRWGRKLCHRPLVRSWTCLPLRSEVKEVENSAAAETWRQTRRPGITESAGAALLSEPSGVNTQLASLWVHSQQNGIKSRPPQNIIMACKMRRAKEDVCCISCGKYSLHVWPGFIRSLAEDAAPNAFANLVLVGLT